MKENENLEMEAVEGLKQLADREDLEKLDMESFTLPGLDKNATNAVFNSLRYLCTYLYPFFEAQGDNKAFVYNHQFDDIQEILKVTVERQKVKND